MKKYDVIIYFTTFCTYEVEAKSEEEAIAKARKLEINKDELLMNLNSWKEADEAFEIDNTKDI